MDCPSRIKVVGKNYAIEILDRVDEDDSLGYSDETNQKVLLKRAQHFEALKDTLLHEVVHAIDHAIGLDLREEQVRGLAGGILQVLRDNPKFARFLLERAKR